MSDEITIEVFNHLVTLAALELDDEQSKYLRRELNRQLDAIHELEAIPLDEDLRVSAHGVPYTKESSPQLRNDEWQPFQEPEEILKQAPQLDGNYIVVPDIPHEKLD
jgi:aspartyl-tRNA(Asn)/glutamyl-tRNA(Gln) amidotransferase subunit C